MERLKVWWSSTKTKLVLGLSAKLDDLRTLLRGAKEIIRKMSRHLEQEVNQMRRHVTKNSVAAMQRLKAWWFLTKPWITFTLRSSLDELRSFLHEVKAFIVRHWRLHRQAIISVTLGLVALVTYVLMGIHQRDNTSALSVQVVTWVGRVFWAIIILTGVIAFRKRIGRLFAASWPILLGLAITGGVAYWTAVLYAKKYVYWWAPIVGTAIVLVLVLLASFMSGRPRASQTTTKPNSPKKGSFLDGLLYCCVGLAWMITSVSTLWWIGKVCIGLNPDKSLPIIGFCSILGFSVLRYLIVRMPYAKPNFRMIFGVFLFMCCVGFVGQFIIENVSHPTGTDPMIPYSWILGK